MNDTFYKLPEEKQRRIKISVWVTEWTACEKNWRNMGFLCYTEQKKGE